MSSPNTPKEWRIPANHHASKQRRSFLSILGMAFTIVVVLFVSVFSCAAVSSVLPLLLS